MSIMEAEITQNMVEEYEAVRPMILTSRRFRRSVTMGMKVWRSETRNFDTETEVEHIEIACPHLKWTDRGPVWDHKTDKDDE